MRNSECGPPTLKLRRVKTRNADVSRRSLDEGGTMNNKLTTHNPQPTTHARILGLDVGEKRIGVAVSDPLGITAQPLEVVARDGQGSEWRRLPQILEEYNPQRAVMGLPVNMDGSEGKQTDLVRLFAKTFSRKFPGIEIVFQDERMSTAASERLLLEAGVRRDKRRRKRDVIAAALILQTFLDAHIRKGIGN